VKKNKRLKERVIMPNWVINKVRFESEKVLKDCISKRKYKNYENTACEEEYFDFEKVLPMPKSLSLISGTIEQEAVYYALFMMNQDEYLKTVEMLKKAPRFFYGNYYEEIESYNKRRLDIDRLKQLDEDIKNFVSAPKDKRDSLKTFASLNDIDFDGLGIHNLEELGRAYIKNVQDYGESNWYDWHNKNWGTKWNACETIVLNENEVEFQTAWSTPEPIIKAISKKYHTRVEVEYADEDLGSNCGSYVYNCGELVDDADGNYEFACETWGYDPEEMKEEDE